MMVSEHCFSISIWRSRESLRMRQIILPPFNSLVFITTCCAAGRMFEPYFQERLRMKLFRKVLFWCHLTVGVIGGLVIFIMSVTGVLLTYEKQIIAWSDTHNYQVAPSSAG